MKFYIAGRTSRTPDIKEMVRILRELGHEITHDWTVIETGLTRPYPEDIASSVATKDLNGVKDADVFIILGDSGGTGMYVELGCALSTGAKVYSIGERGDETVFQFLPQVKRVETFEEVLYDLEN